MWNRRKSARAPPIGGTIARARQADRTDRSMRTVLAAVLSAAAVVRAAAVNAAEATFAADTDRAAGLDAGRPGTLSCHARDGRDLSGDAAYVWGMKNLVESAGACCAQLAAGAAPGRGAAVATAVGAAFCAADAWAPLEPHEVRRWVDEASEDVHARLRVLVPPDACVE